MGKETIATLAVKIGTLTERVNNLIDIGKTRQTETISSIDNLCNKVNHQHSELTKRVTMLENKELAESEIYKARVQVYKVVTAILGVTLSILGILKYFGVI